MAQFREREEDENDGIPVDLKQKVCPTCRRKLQPWEKTCPEDGSLPVDGVEMGAVEDGILGRLNPALLEGLEDETTIDEGAWDEGAAPATDPSDDPLTYGTVDPEAGHTPSPNTHKPIPGYGGIGITR